MLHFSLYIYVMYIVLKSFLWVCLYCDYSHFLKVTPATTRGHCASISYIVSLRHWSTNMNYFIFDRTSNSLLYWIPYNIV